MAIDGNDLIALAKEDPDLVISKVSAELEHELAPAERSVLLRAQSIAQRTKGALDASVRSAERAAHEATEAGLDEQAGLALATLGATLMHSGDIDAAHNALIKGRDLLSGAPLVQLEMHLAGLHATAGSVDEALELFQDVAERAQALDLLELAADALGNRGVIAAYAGQLDAARADISRARSMFESLGRTVGAAQMTHNLGWLAGLRGDFQEALDAYELAAPTLQGFDFWEDSVRLLDRAEAELNAGLFSDAAADASAAAARFRDHRAESGQADALLVLAQAHLARRDHDSARSAAEAATALFTRQDRPGWKVESDLVLARCHTTTDLQGLVTLASELEQAGQHRSAITARLLAAGAGRIDLLELIPAADKLPLMQRLLYDLARARDLWRRGESHAALRLLRTRLHDAATLRTSIESADVRAGLSAVLSDIREFAIVVCAQRVDPAGVFEFAEWGSLAFAESAPLAAPVDTKLAAAMAELRTVNTALRAVERAFGEVGQLPEQAWRSERKVADIVRRTRRGAQANLVEPVPIETAAHLLAGTRLARFVVVGNDLVRIDLTDTATTLASLGSTAKITTLVADLCRATERALTGSSSVRAEALAAERVDTLAEQLDHLLLEGVVTHELVVVPGPALGSVPWSLLPSRRSGTTLVLPTAGLLTQTDGVVAGRRVRTAVIAGTRLEHAQREAELVAELYETPILVTSIDATVAAAISALAGAHIAHIAAHGHLRADQPMLSSIELHDGPLTLLDLHQVSPAPHIVVLANCSSARSLAADGAELFGAAAVLLGAGTRFVIGCPVALPDDPETLRVMVSLHRSLAAGDTVVDALASCRHTLDGRAQQIAQSLVVFGSPAD